MGDKYEKVEEDEPILEMVRAMMREFHSERLEDARFKLLWRVDYPGVLGGSRRATETERLLAGEEFDFVLWFCRASWRYLTYEQQRALVDHQLCTCRKSGDKLMMVKPDVNEFSVVLQRHSFWRNGSERLVKMLQPHFAFYDKLDEAEDLDEVEDEEVEPTDAGDMEERDVLDQVGGMFEADGGGDGA